MALVRRSHAPALDTGVVNMMGHSSGRKVVMVTSQDDVVEIVLEKNKLEEPKEKVATWW